jgi:hypothetical protein
MKMFLETTIIIPNLIQPFSILCQTQTYICETVFHSNSGFIPTLKTTTIKINAFTLSYVKIFES